MLLACDKQGYSRYKANKMIQVRLNKKVKIKEGEKPKEIRWKSYYSEKTEITQQEIKQHSFFNFRKDKLLTYFT